jgi:hypothetical protein
MIGSIQYSIRINVVVELAVAAILILSPLFLAGLPWQGKKAHRTSATLLIISAAVLMLVTLLSDAIFGVSASWIFTGIVWAVGLGTALAVRLRYRSVLAVVVAVVVTCFVLALHFIDILPVKPYKRFFAAIKVGMTEQEVLTLLHREFPEGGALPVPVRRDFAKNQMDFFLDPKESAWNAEGIFIQLSDGQVVSKKYSRD